MAGAFPLEEQALEQQPATWNPWNGPTHPGFFTGFDDSDPNIQDSEFGLPGQRTLQAISRRLTQGALTGASQLEIALAKHNIDAAETNQQGPLASQRAETDKAAQADAQEMLNSARERIKANTPDATTVGAAAQIVHGLGKVGAEFVPATLVGAPEVGAALVAQGEFAGRKDELMQQGVDEATANRAGAVSAVTNAAGVVLPFAWGRSLLMKVGTGVIANTGLGIANRYADHKILEDAGYKEMADQIKVMDSGQIIIDAAMGGFFGGQAYLHEYASTLKNAHTTPGFEDAAMTSNLANADRRSSPGVPTTPEAAGVHQAALETAIEQLSTGQKVDVSNEYRSVLYHGSPHDFEQFDMSKLGTGEGNQSYGHGLYFAENEDVARTYTEGSAPSYKHVPQPDGRIKMVPVEKEPGTTYTVSVPAGHIDRMLDWDRPISEQPHVMEALGVDPNKPSQLPNRVTPDMTGQELYSALSKGKTNLGVNPTPADASRFLNEKGIPGIKYKDQGSRGLGSGTGTRNVVLFSDKDIRITHKNGVPVERPPEFLQRPAPETKAAAQLLQEHLKQGNILDEEANLRDLEALLAQKRTLPERPTKATTKPSVPPKSGTTVSAAEQKAYVEHAKAGYEVKMNPAESDGKGNLVSKDGKTPVFEVTGKIAQDAVKQALTEKPNMTIPSANGEVKAADAIKAVDEAVAKGQKEIPAAIKAATDCFGRKGG